MTEQASGQLRSLAGGLWYTTQLMTVQDIVTIGALAGAVFAVFRLWTMVTAGVRREEQLLARISTVERDLDRYAGREDGITTKLQEMREDIHRLEVLIARYLIKDEGVSE